MKSSLFCTINPVKPKPTSYKTQIQILILKYVSIYQNKHFTHYQILKSHECQGIENQTQVI